MNVFRFDREAGKPITAFNSAGAVISRVIRLTGPAHIGCIHLEAGGTVGFHEAVAPQLFLVVQGSGWVRGEEDTRVPIQAGQAAFWTKGEGHESGTESGMTAIVIESGELDPAAFMPSV